MQAISDVSGTNSFAKTGPNGYDNLEEFTAVEVTNVLISEDGGGWGRLLGDHHGGLLPLALIDSQAFYKRYSTYIEQVCVDQPWHVKELKKATGIEHNPFVYCTGV
jgi:hypothetical protein